MRPTPGKKTIFSSSGIRERKLGRITAVLSSNPGDQGLFHYAKFLAHDIPMNFSLERHGKLTLTSHYAGILPEENARLAGQLSIYKLLLHSDAFKRISR